MHQILIFVYQGAEVVRMYKTLLGSQGFRKVENDPSWFLCDNQLYHKSVHPGKFNHNCFLYFRAWIFILKDMMVKLWHVKIFLLPCEMQMMQISLISYNGIDLSFIFFELPSVFLCLPWNVIKLQVLPSWYTSGESYFILWCWSSYFHLKVQVYMLTSLREA